MKGPTREQIWSALFADLIASVSVSFTADLAKGSAALSNPSTTDGMFLGLPVFGEGVPAGAVIASLAPLQLSLPAISSERSVSLTTGFLTTGRRLLRWNEVTSQPAIFLRPNAESFSYRDGEFSPVRRLTGEIFIYANGGKYEGASSIVEINALLDAVQSILSPQDGDQHLGRYTIGGLVHWCRISDGEGAIDIYPGDTGDQSIAVIDVEIIVP